MVDYAYAPGGGRYGKKMRRLLKRRGVTLVSLKKAKTLAAFLEYLDSTADKPVGDLYVVSHGNDAGEMEIPLVEKKQTDVEYETFFTEEDADGEPKLTEKLIVLDSLIGTPGGGPLVPTNVRIRGCKIGQSLTMMQLFKEAFGSNVATVTAPRHIHGVRYWGTGYYEFLYSGFEIFMKKRFKKRGDVLDAFKAAGFQYWNGTNINPDLWKHWIPLPGKFKRRKQKWRRRIKVSLNPSIQGLDEIPLDRRYRHYIERVPIDVEIIGNPSDYYAYMQDSLRASKIFDPLYGYPLYERYYLVTSNGPLFQNIDQFFDAFAWKFTPVRNKKTNKRILKCVGRRHAYEVRIPITSTGTLDGDLLFNFFSNSGAAEPHLPEDDSRLFRTVSEI